MSIETIPHTGGARWARAAGTLLAATALALGGGTVASSAHAAPLPAEPAAQDNPHERGPDPTEDSIEAPRGHFDVDEDRVSSLRVTGFGGGTIYYPTDTSEGTFGAVAISPGYTASQSSISWLGPRLASQGFVVFTIDTLTRYDQPNSRGRQLERALDYLVEDSSVADRIDPDRLALMGHSMGGGGTLAAAEDDPDLQAAIPLTGWHTQKTFDLDVPTLVVGAENDSVASVRTHSIPFYENMPRGLDKAYLELNNASHFAPNFSNTTIAKYSISWLKRFVDDDLRYDRFLCPAPGTDFDISDYRSTCPYN
ncbi:alpha/beta hydrolase family protein [Nocardiopsis chromatogenes]|uniref:alpha/beta hydrolase family protein n=1 Tax=Nocardiopsis chromatogenes TaxID=280239 RepID=UPI000349A17F|nr:dienelactone hydrolase family protein [Nocardiopsis chromatogenes]